MKIATKAQLDRATKASREVERLRAVLESNDPVSGEDWARFAKAYSDARAEETKALRVLANIEAFNERKR